MTDFPVLYSRNEILVIEMLMGFRYVRYSNLPPKYDFVFENIEDEPQIDIKTF